MKFYVYYGFLDFIVCLGYKGNLIKEYFFNYEVMNNDFIIKLEYFSYIFYYNNYDENFLVILVNIGLEIMMGGRVGRVRKYISEEIFMVIYGDGVVDINIKDLVEYYKSYGRLGIVIMV